LWLRGIPCRAAAPCGRPRGPPSFTVYGRPARGALTTGAEVGTVRRVWLRGALAYAPAVAWAALLLYVGSRPSLTAPPVPLYNDKVAHFLAYGVLGCLLGIGWRLRGVVGDAGAAGARGGDRRRAGRGWWLPVLLAIAVGAADELHQQRVEGRSAEVGDFLADTAGVLAGFALGARWRGRERRRKTHDG
jgi:VanZ family protein